MDERRIKAKAFDEIQALAEDPQPTPDFVRLLNIGAALRRALKRLP